MDTHNEAPVPAPPARLSPGSRKALFAAVTGTVIEWYDYALYGAAAGLVIGPLFFQGTGAGATIAAFATFAVGFIARPLGGLLVGYLGDRHGRRPAMFVTLVLMGIATVGIGLLPTAESVGVLAPILLVMLRLMQGMGAGAELAGAMTIVAEFAPPNKRGILTSIVMSTPPLGISLATLAFLAVSALGDEALLGWAWRIPFLLSAVLFVLAIWIRSKLEETPEYLQAQREAEARGETKRVPIATLMKNHGWAVFTGFLVMTGHSAVNYSLAVFSIPLMSSDTVGLTRTEALTAVTLGTLVAVITTPFGGWLSDKIGGGRTMALGCAIGIITIFPILNAMTSGSALKGGLAVAAGYAFIITFTSGSQGAFYASLFPASERMSGTAMARELNGAVVAGFTPLIMTYLQGLGGGAITYPALFIIACCAVTIVAVVNSPKERF